MRKILLTSVITLLTASTFATTTQAKANQTESFKVRYEKWKKEQANKKNAEQKDRQAFAQQEEKGKITSDVESNKQLDESYEKAVSEIQKMKDGKYGGLTDSQVDTYLKKLNDYKEGYYTFGSIERILNEARTTHNRQWGYHRFAIPNSQR